MKKIFYTFLFLVLIILTGSLFFLSTIGFETDKFNNLIAKELKKKEPSASVKINKIKIKLDLINFDLYLKTDNALIEYQNINIPIQEFRAYFKLISFVKNQPQLHRAVVLTDSIKIKDLQKIAIRIKPSNFKSYLLNNIEGGELTKGNFDLKFEKDLKIIKYEASGKLKTVNAKTSSGIEIKNISLNFILDKELVLINSINANYKGISLVNGNIEIEKKNNIRIKANINSKFDLDKKKLNKLFPKKTPTFFVENLINTKGEAVHDVSLELSDTFKILNYEYNIDGNLPKLEFFLKKKFRSSFIKNEIEKISLNKSKIKVNLNNRGTNFITIEGNYRTNNSLYRKFSISNNLKKNSSRYIFNIDLTEIIFIEILNFKNKNKKLGNIAGEIVTSNNGKLIKKIKFIEDKNLIEINNLEINKKYQIKKFNNIKIKTFKEGKINNDLEVKLEDKIYVKGKTYDATFLLKNINSDTKSIILNKINKNIEITFDHLITSSLIPLNNFNLIGKIKSGKFIKILSKSELADQKYLDISLKSNNNNKKILEIYSDSPKLLLADFKFFKGIEGGKLLLNSVFDDAGSETTLVVDNFKITKAPAFATLLTLADLSGYADLLSGEGMSFESLDVKLKSDKNTTTVEEILALGSSISLHMDGYIEKKSGLISLSGTMVPAKTLNTLISKIPVVGNILVGKKVYEGVFGVSFKMKGNPENIKTTVNPVKSLTPRFVTRALEKMKKKQPK